MAQKRKEWMKSWGDGAAYRDLPCIIEYMKGVNNASGPIDLYELGDFIAPSRGGEEVKNFFLYTLEFIRLLVSMQEQVIGTISVASHIFALSQRSDSKTSEGNLELLRNMFLSAAGADDTVKQLWNTAKDWSFLFSEKIGRDPVHEISKHRAHVKEDLAKQQSDLWCLSGTQHRRGFPMENLDSEYVLRILYNDLSGLAHETAETCLQAALAGMRYRAYMEEFSRQPYFHREARIMVGNELERARFWCGVVADIQDALPVVEAEEPRRITLSRGLIFR